VHWQIMQEEAARTGHAVDRDRWRLMGPMHIAETTEQAKRNCAYGLRWQDEYRSHITPSAIEVPATAAELADALNKTGRGVIGTPGMAAAQIDRLLERSGGFGTDLFQGADFASWHDTLRSYELFAEEVIPRFNGQLASVLNSYQYVLGETEANRSSIADARGRAGTVETRAGSRPDHAMSPAS
jgi:limonene 1,2-monooxygenase